MTKDNLFCKKKIYIIRDRKDDSILTNYENMLMCFPSKKDANRKLLKTKSIMDLKIDEAIIYFKSKILPSVPIDG